LRYWSRGLAIAATALVVLVAVVGMVQSRRAPSPNVLLVVLDTVRADAVDGAGDWSDLTPNLRRLADDATVFTRAWANAPWTVPSHASLFTGLLPSEHRCTSRDVRLTTSAPTIAELLQGAGYQTVAFYSNPWLSDRATGLLRGFAAREESGRPGGPTILTSAHGGPETVGRVNRWLATKPARPFFMFVNILEAHLPYDPPPDYRAENLEGSLRGDVVSVTWAQRYNAGTRPPQWTDTGRLRSLYGGDVNTADRLLGALLGSLEARGLLEETVVIVTSDHGENLGDHSIVGHQFGVPETLLEVPLVVRAPGLLERGIRDDPVMLTDVFATILEAARVSDGLERPHSRSLLSGPGAPERPLVAEYRGAQEGLLARLKSLNPALDVEHLGAAFSAVRVGDLKLTTGSDGTTVLSDLSASGDESHDLSSRRPDDVRRLRGLVPSRAAATQSPPALRGGADPILRKKLGSLGYLQ